MIIKKLNEWTLSDFNKRMKDDSNIKEDVIKENQEKIQNLKKLLEQVYEDGADNIEYSDEQGYESTKTFDEYWGQYGDKLILDSGILDD